MCDIYSNLSQSHISFSCVIQTQEMSTVLSRQSELETNLKIARSNLALAENHAEALEDTLKRNSSSRLSNGSGTMLGYSPVPPPVPAFPSPAGTAPTLSIRTSTKSPNLAQGAFGEAHEPESATAPSPRLGSFWKRRPTFGTSSHPNLEALSRQQHPEEVYDTHTGKRSSTSLGINHPVKAVNSTSKANHRLSYETTSDDENNATIVRRPSFGMLRSSSANVPGNNADKAQAALIKSLQSQLAQSKHAYSVLQTEFQTLQQSHATLSNKYSSLQDEIENLSVSLFEEANTMVAEERKVNSFLNESLDKAKTEVDDLQKQVDDLKAALSEKDRVASPALSMKSNRRRTSVSSNHHSHPSRNRRRSSIAALDALESYVASSPRRASRDLAAAAAAVRSLGQSHSSERPSLPHSASVSSFNRLQLSASNPTRSPASSFSAPSSSALPVEPAQLLSQSTLQVTTADQSEDQFDTLRPQRVTSPKEGVERPAETSLDPHDVHEDQAPTSASSLRARWFSFGSRRRPKQHTQDSSSQGDLSSPVPASSPVSASPIDGAARQSPLPERSSSPRAPPRSPDRNQKHTRLNSSFSPEMFKPGLPKVGEDVSIHQYATSPVVSLAQNVKHLVSPSARSSSHSRGHSTSSLKNTTNSRPTLPFSPAGSNGSNRTSGLNRSLSAFSSPASRRPGTGPRELILLSGGSATSSPRSLTQSPRRELPNKQQGDSTRSSGEHKHSPNDSHTLPRSPSQSRYMPVAELHSILDQINTDELPDSFSRLTSPSSGRPTSSAMSPFANLQEQLDSASKPAATSLRSHRQSWSISSDRSRNSGTANERPASQSTLVTDNALEAPEERPVDRVSPEAAVPLSLNKASLPRPRPIITSNLDETAVKAGDNTLQDQLSPFALPTPPIFKRFPRETNYRTPLYSPSKSQAMALQRSESGGVASSNDLRRSGSTASNASFSRGFDPSRYGLQRQGSNMSVATGTGSVVEDLDTLMRSIDAISESLGLEGNGLDESFYEQARPSSP